MGSALRKIGFGGAALVTALVALAASPAAPDASGGGCGGVGEASPKSLRPAEAREATFCLINRERAQAGKPALDQDGKLERAAQRHSELMAETACFSHDCPGEGDLGDRLSSVGYLVAGLLRWAYGENIAYGTGSHGTPRAIVDAWMNSPPHRAMMLNGSFRDGGVGFAVRSGNRGYYTLDVGMRKG
jgi:uncharacterized protein YkwD